MRSVVNGHETLIKAYDLPHQNLHLTTGFKNEIREIILGTRVLQSPILIDYISSRSIDLELAKRYCREVDFSLYNSTHTAIGFNNDSGGFELRNSYFKGSSSPKFTTLICTNTSYERLLILEGYFDFLSHLTAERNNHKPEQLSECQPSYLVLNSLSFFEMSTIWMEQHRNIQLFLDRDKAGIEITYKALNRSSKYQDYSSIYKGFKDYNNMLTNKPLKEKQSRRLKKGL